jgi:hypothetical protein
VIIEEMLELALPLLVLLGAFQRQEAYQDMPKRLEVPKAPSIGECVDVP